MKVLVTSFILFLLIYNFSKILGNYLLGLFSPSLELPTPVFGFLVFLGLLGIIDILLLTLNIKTDVIFTVFGIIIIILLAISINYIRVNVILSEFIVKISIFTILVLLSLKFTLGEQLGDNIYLTNIVTMNIKSEFFNTINYMNGYSSNIILAPTSKIYLTWYHFFTFILYIQTKIFSFINIQFIPSYIVFFWTANFLFYYFLIDIFIFYFRMLRISNDILNINYIIYFFYWGTIYYYLVLPYFGTNFIVIFVAFLWIYIFHKNSDHYLYYVFFMLLIYGIESMGNVGIISSFYIVFSFIVYEIFTNHNSILKWVPILLIPIFHFLILIDFTNFYILITFYFLISLISILTFYITFLNNFLFKYKKYLFLALFIIWIGISIFFTKDLAIYIKDFFDQKSNFDRVQDYFTFVNLNESLRNIAFYISIFGLFINLRTRKLGYMILIIFIFFVNPFIYPFLYNKIQWLYHRAYISIFNSTIIFFGIYGLSDYLSRKVYHSRYLLIIWSLLLMPLLFNQVTGYFNPIYIPSKDFNLILKLDNKQLQILEKLREIILIEKYENPLVISQIYGTTLYIPEVYQIYFNVYNRRDYDPQLTDNQYDPLYRIFYTPTTPGDDGPRFNAPVRLTCDLLTNIKVDFVIYDKSLSVFDDQIENWMPIYFYARDCAELVFENDRYILYRFYWK